MGNTKSTKYEVIAISFLLLVCVIPALLLNIVDPSGHKLMIIDDKIKIKSEIFNVEDIKKIEFLEDINIKSRIKGTRTSKYIRGSFKIDYGNEVAKVYVYRENNTYIRIELDDKVIIYNDEDSNGTKETYKKLINECEYNKNSK